MGGKLTATVTLGLCITISLMLTYTNAGGPPQRPEGGFRSEQEIASYLNELRQYWVHNSAPR